MGMRNGVIIGTCSYSAVTRAFRYLSLPGLVFLTAIFGIVSYGFSFSFGALRIPFLVGVVVALLFFVSDICNPQYIEFSRSHFKAYWWFGKRLRASLDEVKVIGPLVTIVVFFHPTRSFWVRTNMQNIELLIELIECGSS